jgi:hypothetical protein
MSNVLKSKVLLGAMIVLAAVVGAMFIATTANAYTHSMTLKMGMSNSQVMELQKALNATSCKVASSGAGSMGWETMYFGGLTKAAVMCYQAANGLASDGVVGPMTGAKLGMVDSNDDSNENDDDSDDDSDLQGGAGSVDEYDTISGLSGEEVGEDEEDVEVAGLEIEADDGSDLEFTAVRIAFCDSATDSVTSTSYGCAGGVTATATSDFEDYASEVSVWFDGEEVARLDADEFNDDNDWAKTVSLDGAVLGAGETGELTVAVSGISNLDSGDAGDSWGVDFKSVRFVDGQGASTTEDPTTSAKLFTVDTFASSTDLEVKVELNNDDDDINDAHVIEVDDSDDTENVEILSFTIEADGDSDVMIKDLPVNVDVTGASHVDEMITEITLWHDGDQVGDSPNVGSSVGTDETYTFEDVDVEIGAGDTAEFKVAVTLKGTSDTLDNGDTISAQLSSTEVDAIDAEDESGEDVDTSDLTGTATGEAHAVYDEGIKVKLYSVSKERTFVADAAGEDDQGEYEIVFDVTAFGDHMYIDNSTEDDNGSNAAGQGAVFDITSSAGTPTVSSKVLTASGTETNDDLSNEFWIQEDDTRRFTLSVVLTADSTPTDGSHEVVLESINWADASTAEAAGGVIDSDFTNYYTFNLDEFKTGTLFLNGM